MILGDFIFSIRGLSQNGVSIISDYRWESIDRIEGLPFFQYLGEKQETVEITGVFYPKFSENYKTISDIKNSNLISKPNNFISDSGEVLGKFVITSIEENQSYFDKDIGAKRIEFSIKLKKIPDEQVGSSLETTISNVSNKSLRW